MNHNEPLAERRLQLVDKVIDTLISKHPEWRTRAYRPSHQEMAALTEDAEFLLRTVESHYTRSVYAYQLFSPDDPMMSARKIADRFKEFGWVNGKSHNTIRSLINTLLGHAATEASARSEAFAGLITERTTPSDSTSPYRPKSITDILEELGGEVGQLLDKLGFSDVVTDSTALREAVVASVVKCVGMQLHHASPAFRNEDLTASLAASSFMKYVCGAATVKEFEARDEKSVRPHELFLFAYQQGLCEADLSIDIRRLASDAEESLGRSTRNALSILESHGGIDEAINAWLRKNDPQSLEPYEAKLPSTD